MEWRFLLWRPVFLKKMNRHAFIGFGFKDVATHRDKRTGATIDRDHTHLKRLCHEHLHPEAFYRSGDIDAHHNVVHIGADTQTYIPFHLPMQFRQRPLVGNATRFREQHALEPIDADALEQSFPGRGIPCRDDCVFPPSRSLLNRNGKPQKAVAALATTC